MGQNGDWICWSMHSWGTSISAQRFTPHQIILSSPSKHCWLGTSHALAAFADGTPAVAATVVNLGREEGQSCAHVLGCHLLRHRTAVNVGLI